MNCSENIQDFEIATFRIIGNLFAGLRLSESSAMYVTRCAAIKEYATLMWSGSKKEFLVQEIICLNLENDDFVSENVK